MAHGRHCQGAANAPVQGRGEAAPRRAGATRGEDGWRQYFIACRNAMPFGVPTPVWSS